MLHYCIIQLHKQLCRLEQPSLDLNIPLHPRPGHPADPTINTPFSTSRILCKPKNSYSPAHLSTGCLLKYCAPSFSHPHFSFEPPLQVNSFTNIPNIPNTKAAKPQPSAHQATTTTSFPVFKAQRIALHPQSYKHALFPFNFSPPSVWPHQFCGRPLYLRLPSSPSHPPLGTSGGA